MDSRIGALSYTLFYKFLHCVRGMNGDTIPTDPSADRTKTSLNETLTEDLSNYDTVIGKFGSYRSTKSSKREARDTIP